MDKRLRKGEDDPSVITEMNVLAVLLYAQGKMDQVLREFCTKWIVLPRSLRYICKR